MALTTVRSTGISSLPSISGANLTSLTAANLTGALPSISGSNLTGISGGKLGQVVHDVSTSKYSTNSTSYVSIFSPTAITPTATSSKILVSWYCSAAFLSNTTNLGHLAVQREIGGSAYAYVNSSSGHNNSMYTYFAENNRQGFGLSFEFLDTPNTTSAVRYYVQHKTDNTGVTLYLNQNIHGQGGHMFMTTKEILA